MSSPMKSQNFAFLSVTALSGILNTDEPERPFPWPWFLYKYNNFWSDRQASEFIAVGLFVLVAVEP